MFEDYDPKKHKNVQLYEIVTVRLGDIIGCLPVKTDISEELAAQTPWYYVVKVK